MEETQFDKVWRFHEAAKQTANQWPPSKAEVELRRDLIAEEVRELFVELFPMNDAPLDPIKIAKELADLLYVTFGTAVSFGIPMDDVFEEVHKSNMTKTINPEWNENGKLKKGDDYVPPNLAWVVSGEIIKVEEEVAPAAEPVAAEEKPVDNA